LREFEQGGKEKADYGSQLLDELAKDLSEQYGKGFSRSNVFQLDIFICVSQKSRHCLDNLKALKIS